MGRPAIDDDVLDRLTEAVDARTKVPATHLTTEERLDFALDALDEVEQRAQRLADRVNTLETELEEARSEDTDAPGVEEIADANLGGGLQNNLGPNRRRR